MPPETEASDDKDSTPLYEQVEESLRNGNNEDLETAKSYKVDVDRALARETDDGKGDEDPGPSDWVSYATEGVEKEDTE